VIKNPAAVKHLTKYLTTNNLMSVWHSQAQPCGLEVPKKQLLPIETKN